LIAGIGTFFKPAIEEAGFEPYRVDEDPGVEVPIEDIERGIREAAVCFAEITTDNPNVWYELGYARASLKPVVMVSERRQKFPFDVQHRSIIIYDTGSSSDFDTLKTKIIAKLKAIAKTKPVEDDLPKANPKPEIDLRFVLDSPHSNWFMEQQSMLLVMHIWTFWHVTNVRESSASAKLLEARLLQPQGEVMAAVVSPTTSSEGTISPGQTNEFLIRFQVKSIPDPESNWLDVTIAVFDQLGEQHNLPTITLQRRASEKPKLPRRRRESGWTNPY